MRMNSIPRMFCTVLSPGVLVVGLFIAGPDHMQCLGQANAIAAAYQSEPAKRKSPEYKVTPFFVPEDQTRFAIVYVTVDPKNFNHQDMNSLASKLNRGLGKQRRLKAALFDDNFIPQLMVKGGVQLSDFYKAQRGLYYLDRIKCREYIQFSTKKGRPRNEVTIKFKCSPATQSENRGPGLQYCNSGPLTLQCHHYGSETESRNRRRAIPHHHSRQQSTAHLRL